MLVYFAILFLIVAWLVFMIIKLLPIFNMLYGGIPFVRSEDSIVRDMIELADIKNGERVIDIGCGDGTVMIEVAKRGYAVEGIELNPILVNKCKRNIKKNKLEKLAYAEVADFWKTDLSEYDVIFIYGISFIMGKLEKKLQGELKPGARVVSNFFEFPNWPVDKVMGRARIYHKK